MEAIGFFFWLIIIALIAIAWVVITNYNKLQSMSQAILAAHANVMASMKKRLDLITKLMDIASGYADHEKLAVLGVAQEGGSTSLQGFPSQSVSGTVQYVTKLATQFPDLKASATYQQLMGQLNVVEDDLQKKREIYNWHVQQYNTKICQFPTNLYAGIVGFKIAPFFTVEDADSLESIKDFTSNDGQAVRDLLSNAGRQVAYTTRQLGDTVVTKGKEMSAREQMPKVVTPADEVKDTRADVVAD